MPDVGNLGYLLAFFRKVGMVATGEGLAPISYAEIKAFSEVEGDVSREDMQALREMSVAFVMGMNKGRDPFARPPWDGD